MKYTLKTKKTPYKLLIPNLIRYNLYNIYGYAASRIVINQYTGKENIEYLVKRISMTPFMNEGVINLKFKGTTLKSNELKQIKPVYGDVIINHENDQWILDAEIYVTKGYAKNSAKYNNIYKISLVEDTNNYIINLETDYPYTLDDIKSLL